MTMKTSFRRRSSDPAQRLLLFVDNTTLNAGSGGDVIATDDIGGVKYQIVKTTYGALDSQTIASSGTGVDDAGTQRVTLATDISVPIGDGTDIVDVFGSSASDGEATSANPLNTASFSYGFNGTTWDRLRSDITNGLDVDVTRIIPGVGATNLGKAEDAVHSSGDVGVMGLGVRSDALVPLGADGDYVPLQFNNKGALWVDLPNGEIDSNNSTTTPINANIDYTGTGTDVTPHAGITVNIFADQDSDANGMRFQFSSDGTNWDIEVDGGFDYQANSGRTFQFDILARYFRVIFQNAGTNQTAFRLQTILHHHPVSLTTIHRADDDLAPDRSCTVTKSINMYQAAGTGDFTPAQATAAGNPKVSIQEISDGLDIGAGNAGSETARISISTDDVNLSAIKTASELIDNPIVAHDAAVSGSTGVDMAGARATNSVEGITQVANADATRLQADLNGVLLSRNGTTLEEIVTERVSNTNGTSTDFTGAFAAQGAGNHCYITEIAITNTHASTNGYVDFRDGSAGAIKWTMPAPAGGGSVLHFDPPLKFAANTAVAFDVSAAITTVYIACNGYVAQG